MLDMTLNETEHDSNDARTEPKAPLNSTDTAKSNPDNDIERVEETLEDLGQLKRELTDDNLATAVYRAQLKLKTAAVRALADSQGPEQSPADNISRHDGSEYRCDTCQATGNSLDDIDHDESCPGDSVAATDGGTVLACPECESSELRRKTNQYDDGDPEWVCADCKNVFVDAIEREAENPGPINPDTLAATLDNADPDDLATDGGQDQITPETAIRELTQVRHEILLALARDGISNTTDVSGYIRDLFGRESAPVKSAIIKLEERGYIERVEIGDFASQLELTEKAREMLRRDAQRRYNALNAGGGE